MTQSSNSNKALFTLMAFGMVLAAQAHASISAHPFWSTQKMSPEQEEYLRQALQALIEGGGIKIDEVTGDAKIDELLLETFKKQKRLEIKVASPGTLCSDFGGR